MTSPTSCDAVRVAVDLLDGAIRDLAAAAVDSPRLNAELLLAAALGMERTALYTRLQQPVPPAAAQRFRALLARRRQRVPLQYLLGHQEFWSLDFQLTPDVLIPRPETEHLVDRALALFPQGRKGAALTLCDVGTGSGCLAIALAHEWPAARVVAIDRSAAALRVALGNALRCGVAERVLCGQGDLLAAAKATSFDLIVSNPPYVSTTDLDAAQPELAFEPRSALDGGPDGLDVIRRLLVAAPGYLKQGGWLLMEIGADQGAAVRALAGAAGAQDVVVEDDFAGRPRVLKAGW